MIQNVEGARQTTMEVPRTVAGRLLRPVNGVNDVISWRGELIVGTVQANRGR